jgi:transcriptional regulator with XRE-family HTH domain
MVNRKNDWTPESEEMFQAMTVGERVRWLLEVRGLKQVEAAARMNATQPMLSNILTDASRKPSAPTLLKMAEVLECSPSWILDGRGNPFAWAVVSDARAAELLQIFRRLAPAQQDGMLAMARTLG